MAGESYLLVVITFAVSLNFTAENSSRSPAPPLLLVWYQEREGGTQEKRRSLSSVIFFGCLNFWNASSKKG